MPLGDSARPVRRPAIPHALGGGADRPDPTHGVFSTMLAREGVAVDAGAHLARLERSTDELYGLGLPGDLEERIAAAAATAPALRLRVSVVPRRGSVIVDVETEPLDGEPEPAQLAPAYLPGGLGPHKWSDRRLLDELERDVGALPPLDGRLLPGTMRRKVLAAAPPAGLEPREEAIRLERLAAADEVLLSSAIRGVRPAALAGGRS